VEPVNAAIIYYSSTGTVHTLAAAAAEGAEKAGAQVRLRKVAESAPAEAIDAKPAWGQHLRDTADVAEASLDDLDWADVGGGIIVSPGYTDPVQFQTGNPYGTSHVAATDRPPTWLWRRPVSRPAAPLTRRPHSRPGERPDGQQRGISAAFRPRRRLPSCGEPGAVPHRPARAQRAGGSAVLPCDHRLWRG